MALICVSIALLVAVSAAGIATPAKKTFQQKYRYNARKPGTKDQIIKLTLNGSDVRDISRVLKINKNTVCSVLKKNSN